MEKILKQCCIMLLVLVLSITLLPVQMFAVYADETTEQNAGASADESAVDVTVETPQEAEISDTDAGETTDASNETEESASETTQDPAAEAVQDPAAEASQEAAPAAENAPAEAAVQAPAEVTPEAVEDITIEAADEAAETEEAKNEGENGVIAEVTLEDGTVTQYTSASELLNAVFGFSGKYTVKLLSNISTQDAGMFSFGKSSDATLDLNGYCINRHKANTKYNTDKNQEVIIVYDNTKLTIIDSDPTRQHNGYLTNGSEYGDFKFWLEDEKQSSCPIYGGIIAGGASDNGGGGITIKENATVTMKGGTIAGNYSYDGGGGVQLRNAGAKFVLDGGKIMYNGAWREKGGGIKATSGAENGIVELISGDIKDNWAHDGTLTDGEGGGIYIDNETDRALYIHGKDTSADGKQSRSVNISGNYAEDEGGGIYLNNGMSTIMNAAIENNKCGDVDGGGILINDDGTSASLTAITNCYINNNQASDDGDGGGIAITDENYIQIANCVITNNTAGDEGGGVYFNAYGDGCAMNGCTVTGNKAKRNGGGIYLYDTVGIGGKMIVKDNTVSEGGGKNLCNYGYVSASKFKITDLSYDSELYIYSEWSNGDVISDGTTIGSAKGMFGEGDYHFEKDNDPESPDFRKIVQKAGKASPVTPETVKIWDSVNREQTRTGTNLGYTMQVDESKGEVNNAPVYRGYLRFSDALKSIEGYYHTMNYYYSDGLFFNDPAEYNKHLASLTASLTMASGAAATGLTTVLDPKTQKNRFNYLTQVFSDIGCTNESMYVNDCYQRRPEKDTMGVAMANKTIYKNNDEKEENAYLLIPIFVRSYNYGPEWISNFTLGSGEGEAQGFSTSADIVMNDLDKYIAGHPEVKSAIEKGRAIFWLGGYSRGGAVTNIVSKRVTDKYTGGSEGTEKGNTVFAYCKSAAQGAVEQLDKEGGYLNIHNIINKSDLVTYVGPNEMGFKRYGVDHYLPGGAAGEVKATQIKYGDDDKTLTIYSDNNDYAVDYYAENYKNLRAKFFDQLAAIMPDCEFTDYFHSATINYAWGNPYTSWIPILGEDMISEKDDSSLSTKAKFCQQFWARLLMYAANTSNAGHAYKGGTASKDYREFYATNKTGHFMTGSAYNQSGSATLQEALSTLIGIAMGGEKELDLSNMMDITGAASDIALDAYDKLIGDLYRDNTPEEYTQWIDKVWGLLTQDVNEEQKAKGYQNLKDILGEDISKAQAVYPTLMAMVFDLINDDYEDAEQNLIGTLAYNGSDLLTDHIVNIAWIRADDDWYAADTTFYNMETNSSAPAAPGAWIAESSEKAAGNSIADGGSANCASNQKLFLRTQPGGAVYYTITADGQNTVEDALYQGGQGVSLPEGKTVTVTAYAKAYDQKSASATYTVNVEKKKEDKKDDSGSAVPGGSVDKTSVNIKIKEIKYTGKQIKPVIEVTADGYTLKEGTDYTISYGKNLNVGKGTIVITGKGAFNGKKVITFKINPKGTKIKKLKAFKKGFTVKWKKQKAKMKKKRITGYQIQIARNKKFTKGKKTYTVKGYKKTSKKIKKLKAGKKYYVRIRTYSKVNGVKYYSAWSKAKKVKTKK